MCHPRDDPRKSLNSSYAIFLTLSVPSGENFHLKKQQFQNQLRQKYSTNKQKYRIIRLEKPQKYYQTKHQITSPVKQKLKFS